MVVAKKAASVVECGAYEWIDPDGCRHIGFVRADARGKLYGHFVRDDGAAQSIVLKDTYGNAPGGSFFGPIASLATDAREPIAKGGPLDREEHLPAPSSGRSRIGLKLHLGNYNGRQKRGVVARSKAAAMRLLKITATDYKNFFNSTEVITPANRMLWENPERVFQCEIVVGGVDRWEMRPQP